ncbi:transporter [Methyloradius palustris]|uniref:Magnesium transporter CorA n=1 Tax=Methyloradius palustris TaxID=2778876 RepID=A0A8D5G1D4_9PROT|nr:transporter [Methyloradius palustris]BCM24308.1 hypothetical protein ZMTM_05670 [Methyloradius palustris]
MQSPDYFQEQNCLICAFLFTSNGLGKPIDLDTAMAWLNNVQIDTQEFIWMHFNLADQTAERWMHANLKLPVEFYETLNDESRSTRIEDVEENLIAIVNDVAFKFSFEPSEIATLWMNVNRVALISARTHPLHSINELRLAVKNEEKFNSPMALLIHLMHDQGDALVKIAREATQKVDDIEDELLKDTLKTQRADLGKLRRVLVRLQRLLAPEPAALFRLLQHSPNWIKEDDLNELRQGTEEFSVVIRDMSALQERIKLLQEEMGAQISEHTNRNLFTLTIVTVLALPINIIAGLLGMNVGGIPLADSPHGFITIVGIVVTFTVLAVGIAFKNR